jgi:hypothetical protein
MLGYGKTKPKELPMSLLDEIENEPEEQYHATHTLAQAIAWACALAFCIVAIYIWYSQGAAIAVFILPWIAVSAWLGLKVGVTTVSISAVSHQSKLGRYQIGWQEVERVELCTNGNGIVLYGSNKRLVLPAPLFWNGAESKQALAFLEQLTERYRIPLYETSRMGYIFSKNTRQR